MKKYEAPMVELTKFDVEDVITASANALNLTTEERTAAVADIKANNGNDFDGVFSW